MYKIRFDGKPLFVELSQMPGGICIILVGAMTSGIGGTYTYQQ